MRRVLPVEMVGMAWLAVAVWALTIVTSPAYWATLRWAL